MQWASITSPKKTSLYGLFFCLQIGMNSFIQNLCANYVLDFTRTLPPQTDTLCNLIWCCFLHKNQESCPKKYLHKMWIRKCIFSALPVFKKGCTKKTGLPSIEKSFTAFTQLLTFLCHLSIYYNSRKRSPPNFFVWWRTFFYLFD